MVDIGVAAYVITDLDVFDIEHYLAYQQAVKPLLAAVGASVKDGDAVATVGNSGGNPDSGLYFELRHRGQPFDPLKWASNR